MVSIGILTRNPHGWATQQLIRAAREENCDVLAFRFRDLIVRIDRDVKVFCRGTDIKDIIDIVLVRPIGKCSLEQAIYRMDILYLIKDLGIDVINDPTSIEIAIDKFRALYLFALNGLKVPYTLVTENEHRIFDINDIPEKLIIKPLFGSRGHGVFSIHRDTSIEYHRDLIWRICFYLTSLKSVLYIQKQISTKGEDYRIFVIGDRAIAGMVRKSQSGWKTNVSQGGKPIPLKNIPREIEDISIKACKIIGCEIAGVDVVRGDDGEYYILEVNTQPGWRGLQECTRIDIAKEIIKYLKVKVRK